MFYNEIPDEFPSIREIKHQIDLVPSASIPNRQAYQNNPLETKEFKKHVKEYMMNRYSFEMDGRPIALVPFTPKKIYDEQLKLKKRMMAKKESLYIMKTFFANKVLPGFEDDVIFWFGTDLFF